MQPICHIGPDSVSVPGQRDGRTRGLKVGQVCYACAIKRGRFQRIRATCASNAADLLISLLPGGEEKPDCVDTHPEYQGPVSKSVAREAHGDVVSSSVGATGHEHLMP